MFAVSSKPLLACNTPFAITAAALEVKLVEPVESIKPPFCKPLVAAIFRLPSATVSLPSALTNCVAVIDTFLPSTTPNCPLLLYPKSRLVPSIVKSAPA